MIVTQNT